MSNYINLIGQITERLDVPCGNIRLGIHEALAYLDRNPSQAPGRTITESKVKWMVDRLEVGFHLSDLLTESLQLEIIPDPEPKPKPTTPEKLAGRTITASEFDEAVESCITEDATVPPHKFAVRLGVVCVPDPEPTESVPGRAIEGDTEMSDNPYTPDEVELIGCYAGAMEEQAGENYATAKADAERGIAKIRADAWDEGFSKGWDRGHYESGDETNPYRKE